MDDTSSDSEFVETNFIEPSPVKQRSYLLPDPKERSVVLKKREIDRAKLKKTDEEFLLYLRRIINGKSLRTIIESDVESPDEIYFQPRNRPYFTAQTGVTSPSKWFPLGSIFHDKSLEEFIYFVKQGFLLPKSQNVDDENRRLQSFCLNLLNDRTDEVTANFLLQFLAKCYIPYDIISLRQRCFTHLERLLQVIKKSIPSYSNEDAHELFREAVMASLDPKCVNICGFPSFLSLCLDVSSLKFPVKEEIDWILDQQLEPEEFSHLLDVLPQSGPFKDVGLLFAARALANITETFLSPTESFTLATLVTFLRQKEIFVRNLPFNSLYHFLNILHYILLRISSFDDLKSVEEIVSFLKGLQRRQPKKEISLFIVNVVINRMEIIVSRHLRHK